MNPGYKHTEIGVIPENWDVESFNQTLKRQNAKAFQIQTSAYLPNGLLPVVDQSQNAIAGYTDETDRRFKCSEEGVIVFGDHTCVVKFVDFDFVVGADGTQLLTAKHENSTRFHAYALEHKGVLSTGYNRHFKFLKERLFVRPPVSEQRAIAEALSDVDGLLSGLDRLIAKKRDLKQAAMQQLLTGQTRLPGFSGEWETKRLGDRVTRLPKTKRLSSDGKLEGHYPFFTNSTQPVDRYLDEKDFDQEAIIANTGGVAYFDYFNGPFAAMADCMVLSAQDNVKWLFYLLKTLEPLINNTGFTGSGIKHLDKEFFFDLNVHIATSPEEQAAIAGTLTAMDSELGALLARRDKTRLLKHGMMQELLTGRIRFVEAEALHA